MFYKVSKIVLCSVIASLLVANIGSIAYAAVPTPKVVITGGSLTIEDLAIADFNAVTLNGTVQTTAATVSPVILTDSTGTGNGWTVSLKASKFMNAESMELPLDSLKLGSDVTVTADEGSTATTNIVKASAGSSLDSVGGVTILNAASEEGMGIYTINMDNVDLTLFPKSTLAGTYTSTVDVVLTSGPEV